MAGDLPEDMVYTITTGFYPELFSGKPMWKAEMGTGRKGMQWVKQRGFSKDSVKRIAGKRIDKGGYGDFLWALKGGMPWKEAYDTLVKTKGEDYAAGIQERGKEVGYVDDKGEFSQAQMEANLNYYRFMGNNEAYQLWGTKVWWQHGRRYEADEMESSLNDWQRDTNQNVGTYLEQLYTKKEKDFWGLARKLAKQVFGVALDEDNLREDLESVGKEAHVPEQERKEATKNAMGEAQGVDSISDEWHEVSKARGLDIKYRMDKDTTIYMDSTEMPLSQAGSHGISGEVTKAMQEAIKEAKAKGKGWKTDLKAAVITMFEKSISLYNIDLKKIMKAAPKGEKNKGLDSIKAIMKEIKRKRQKEKHHDPRASVASVAAFANIDMAENANQATTLKYVIHTIVNLAGDANSNFRQGHLIGRMYGRNTYASVGMQLQNRDKGIPQFDVDYMKKNTLILQGESHMLAYLESRHFLESGKAKETQARQIQAFQQGRIMGAGRTMKGAESQAGANMDLQKGLRPTTRVTFHPKALGDMVDKIPSLVSDNVDEDSIMAKFQKSVGNKRQHKLSDNDNLLKNSKAKFWAMPYLGLMEYPQKAKKSYKSGGKVH